MAAVPQRQHVLERPEPDRRFLRPASPVSHPATPPPPTAPKELFAPSMRERLWVTLVSVALKPFSWFIRCRYCWRGRFRV